MPNEGNKDKNKNKSLGKNLSLNTNRIVYKSIRPQNHLNISTIADNERDYQNIRIQPNQNITANIGKKFNFLEGHDEVNRASKNKMNLCINSSMSTKNSNGNKYNIISYCHTVTNTTNCKTKGNVSKMSS